jgi:L-cysteine:1D-myo-inositol 2-amino-2-deoxy-alpha-D-glucopyranoside ligase
MWEDRHLDEAAERLRRWRAAFARASSESAAGVIERLRDRLSDDLDAPGALRAVDAWADRAGADAAGPSQVGRAVDALLGVR